MFFSHSRLWDTSAGHCLRTLQHGDQAPVASVKFSPSSLQVLAMSLDSAVRLWDLANARILKTYTGHTNTKYAGNAALIYLPSAGRPTTWIVAGSEDRHVYLWDLQTRQITQVLSGHCDTVAAVAVRLSSYPGPSHAAAPRHRRPRAGRVGASLDRSREKRVARTASCVLLAWRRCDAHRRRAQRASCRRVRCRRRGVVLRGRCPGRT